MDDIMEIVTSSEKSGSLIKNVTKTIEIDAKKTKKLISGHVIRYVTC